MGEGSTARPDPPSGVPFVYLASRSPRRSLLLAQLGIPHEILDVVVDEGWDGSETACHYVCRLALAKARHGASLPGIGPAPVLAADTAVVLDGGILGQAENPDEAFRMLGRLSGRCHEVYTAVAVWLPGSGRHLGPALSQSRVAFRPLAAGEQRDYVASGEPFGKAGAYAIQGLAARFIERIEGSYTGIMGLPLYETGLLLQRIADRDGRIDPV